MQIESRFRVESADKVVFSKLHLVDLAGSEMTKKIGSERAIDALKTHLDRKEEERKIRLRNACKRHFEESAEEIIDEEELVLLRKMKDLYRDNFTVLKNARWATLKVNARLTLLRNS